MESTDTARLVEQLTAGFAVLQEEYQKLFGQHQSLERKLATAREQVSHIHFYPVLGSKDETTF
jgi:hypothetical protein